MNSNETLGTALNRVLVDAAPARVGLFRCRPWHALFREDRRALGHYVVFPGSGVYIRHTGQERVVADPNVVMLYNRGQTYEREKLSEQGDNCVYFGYEPPVLLQALQEQEPRAMQRPERPFSRTHSPVDAQTYLMQRVLVAHLQEEDTADDLYVQELALTLLERVVRCLYPRRGPAAESEETRKEHAALTREVKALLATRFDEGLTLPEIADAVYASPYHLCRVFRREAGRTIHQYRNQLRLRAGLEQLLDGSDDVATIAGELGYSSHSHFTQTFRQAFGVTPSAVRETATGQWVQEMSKNLTA
ncbi:MAG TPA: AraC family transcriptional regulator [Candidatus Sulfomarinibacteraceae bacterium]|nr:AraC family transcriptional regulator [Candidatus Sulfomarinibacteraceae bacterium]